MGKVLLIGGSPMTGKSTAARKIAAMYELPAVSTDDIGQMLQTVSDIDPMKGRYYLEYYENTDPDTLMEDMRTYHSAIGKAVARLTEIHSSWGCSMIIEGYAIYPDITLNSRTDAVWLTAPEGLLRSRLESSAAFMNASDKAKENYLSRSLRLDRFIRGQCAKYGRRHIEVTGCESAEELAGIIGGIFRE